MSTTEDRSSDANGMPSAGSVDMKLEVVTIPVSDVDRAKEFYTKLGWRLDVTPPTVVQFTPPGSWCSVQFGPNRTSAAPGSAQNLFLIVSDIQAARDKLVAADIEVSEVFHLGPGGRAGGPDPEHGTYRTYASFSDRRCRDVVRLRQRPGQRDAPRGGRARRAREAHRAAR